MIAVRYAPCLELCQSPPDIDVTGSFRIPDLEMWDEDYFNTATQTYIQIGEDGLGGV